MAKEPSLKLGEFKVVIESFQGQLQKMSEVITHGFARQDQKINSLSEQVANLTLGQTELRAGQAKLEAGQAKLEAGQAKLEAGQAKLEAGQARLEAGQARLEAGQAKLESDVAQIKDNLSAKASQDDLENLEKRVSHMEQKVA